MPAYVIKRLETLARVCPTCQAQPFEPCHIPTDEGRKDVKWFHLSRECPVDDQDDENPGEQREEKP